SLVNQTMLEPPLKSKAELDQLREDTRRIQLYTGTFVSTDESSAAILIGVPANADRSRLYQQVREIVAVRQSANRAQESANRDYLGVTGASVAESLLGIHI